MEQLVNKKSNVLGTVLNRSEASVTLLIDGAEKTYSNSTIKRWWKEAMETTQEVAKEVAEKIVRKSPIVSQKTIVDEVEKTEVVNTLLSKVESVAGKYNMYTKNTRYYIGVKRGKSTLLEIHFNKHGRTYLVMRSHAAHLLEKELGTERCKFTHAPTTYKWSLESTIDVTDFNKRELSYVIKSIL